MKPLEPPKEMSSVVLIRSTENEGLEALLTLHAGAVPIYSAMECFPGGALRNDDCSKSMLHRCHGMTPTAARDILGARLAPKRALGFWVAAIRELFTKTGVLLAVDRNGQSRPMQPGFIQRLGAQRAALASNEVSFQSILESNDLFCDAGSLAYLSHWQTPSQASAAVHTRVFIAALPPGQQPQFAALEGPQGRWLTPDRALQSFSRRELSLAFPAFASLRNLADYETFESVARDFRLKIRT